MKCPDCKTKNIPDANYCYKCCHNFTEQEKENAYNKTIFGLLDKIKAKYEKYTLKRFTDSIQFKIISILFILAIGIYATINYGLEFRVEKSSNYQIQYNKKQDEHYLIVSDDETPLNLYIPSRTKEIVVKEWSNDNELIKENQYSISENITLKVTNPEDYYTIEAIYKSDKTDKLKIYVYKNT